MARQDEKGNFSIELQNILGVPLLICLRPFAKAESHHEYLIDCNPRAAVLYHLRVLVCLAPETSRKD
jgi:hypothetical protein